MQNQIQWVETKPKTKEGNQKRINLLDMAIRSSLFSFLQAEYMLG